MKIPVFPETKVALKGRKGLVVGIANDRGGDDNITVVVVSLANEA